MYYIPYDSKLTWQFQGANGGVARGIYAQTLPLTEMPGGHPLP